MRDTIIMLLAFAAIMGILGYLNGADVQSCMDKGNSFEVCNHTFNR